MENTAIYDEFLWEKKLFISLLFSFHREYFFFLKKNFFV